MKKCIFPILISILLFYPSQGFAEVKEIVSEGTYNMGDGETPSVAESRALLQAKRTALEQAGTYVESYSKVINLQLTEDEIQVLASGLMEVEILDKKRTVVGDGIHFYVKIKAKVNLDKTEEMANRIKAKDKSFVEDYKRIQEAYDKSQKDIEELKKQLAEAKGEKEKKKVEEKIAYAERWLQLNEWVEKGNQYRLKKEYDNAIENYNKAIALNPDDAYIYTWRGTAYYDKGQYDRAIEDFSKAIALNPNDHDAYIYRSLAYYEKGQREKGREDFGRANAIMESSGFSFFYNDRDIEKYSQMIILNPKDVKAYTERGQAYLSKSQYDRAIEDFSMAIVLNPNLGEAYTARGIAYSFKGHYDRVFDDFNKAIALDPNDTQVYYVRGRVYADKGQYDNAIADYTKAIVLDPNSAVAYYYYYRGVAYGKKGQYQNGFNDISKAIELYKQQNQGTIYLWEVELFNQVIALNPKDANIYYYRGSVYRRNGHEDSAIEDFNKAIALDPNLAEAYYERGIAYRFKGQYGRAISDFQKACDLGNENGCKFLNMVLKDR